MDVLYLMIICSVSLAVVFLIIFIIGARGGQFDDDESPAVRMLLEHEIKDCVDGLESNEEELEIVVDNDTKD